MRQGRAANLCPHQAATSLPTPLTGRPKIRYTMTLTSHDHDLSSLLHGRIRYNASEAEYLSVAVMLKDRRLLNGRGVKIVDFFTMNVQ